MKKITAFLLSFLFAFSALTSLDISSLNADEFAEAPYKAEPEVLEKIDELYNLLDGKYFTTTGKSCGNSYCKNCRNVNVFNSAWFKEIFGDVSLYQIPGHAYPGGDTGFAEGWSCHGFANFAMWYIFSTTNEDRVGYNRIVDNVTLTEKNIKKYAKPGDIIRYQNGDSGHSAIFISADENGITVLDCNARVYPDGYCCVRRHTIKYNGYKIAISRARNYTETPDLTLTFNSNGGSFGESFLVGQKYRVDYSTGLNLRAQAGISNKIITIIPKNAEFTVDPSNTVETGGQIWAKASYGKYSGWAVISKYVTLVGDVMSSDYYIKDSIIYSSLTAGAFTQSMVYWKSYPDGLVDPVFLGLFKEGYQFAGWSISPTGETIFSTDNTITPEEILKRTDYNDKAITLYAIWEPLHTHFFSNWTHNGNTNTHFALCDCGFSIINDHIWNLQNETEFETIYCCTDCGITKTVKNDNGVYIIDGEMHIVETAPPVNTWFLVNSNKILNKNIYGQWNKF